VSGCRARLAAAVVVVVVVVGGCGTTDASSMPDCEPGPRVAILAQSVPGAAYVPCVAELPPGWSFGSLEVDDHGAILSLRSDRADRAVHLELTASCDVTDATPIAPSDEGVRTYHLVESINPRYTGRLLDVFPGGCVIASYDFERGPHVALITELQQAVALLSRRELRQGLDADYGITLDP
jgi:hypothetical protein